MGIIAFILLGVMAGLLAEASYADGDGSARVRRSLALGVGGAVAGGLLAAALGMGGATEVFDMGGWAAAFAGGLVANALYAVSARRRVPAAER